MTCLGGHLGCLGRRRDDLLKLGCLRCQSSCERIRELVIGGLLGCAKVFFAIHEIISNLSIGCVLKLPMSNGSRSLKKHLLIHYSIALDVILMYGYV